MAVKKNKKPNAVFRGVTQNSNRKPTSRITVMFRYVKDYVTFNDNRDID